MNSTTKHKNHFELLNKILRGEVQQVYLVGTDLTVQVINISSTYVKDDYGKDTILLISQYIDEKMAKSYRMFGYWNSLNLNKHPYHGGLEMTAHVKLKYVSDIPFDGTKTGRLLYGKENE